jgi:hypothetical protein
MKTSDLTGGAALDWAVAKCEGIELVGGYYNRLLVDGRMSRGQEMLVIFKPSTDWAQGGPIIERECIDLHCVNDSLWEARWWANNSGMVKNPAQRFKHNIQTNGPTPLVAAMRCYVASKLGEEIDVPEALL